MPGLQPDLRWAWVTLALSALVAVGYGVIAFNWYFQSKLARPADSRRILIRLLTIVACGCVCGFVFYVADMPWLLWRLYDGVLLLLVVYVWYVALRTRGLSLVKQRLAEAAELERSAERYREMAELLPHMVWTATGEGQIDFSNRRWIEYVGDQRPWLEAVHPDDRDEVRAWWAEAVASRQAAHREVRLAGSGPAAGAGAGAYRTFAISAVPIVRGEAVKWLGACADIEEQKVLSAEKETEARRKMFYLNALSHDLRAPLNNVVLNAHFLRATAREATEVESANVIVENAIAAGNLVTRLLEFAKAQGRDENATERVSIAATLDQVVRRFRPIAEQKGLYLRLSAHGDVELLTDRQKLERIVSNLVDNAIKFTERGGVTLELVMAGGPGCVVRVRDTGLGVPAQHVPHLFEEFFQADPTTRDRPRGFGMGLAICRSLARQLGGDVRLAQTGPGGSTFEVSVKVATPAGAAAAGTRRDVGDDAGPDDARLCFE